MDTVSLNEYWKNRKIFLPDEVWDQRPLDVVVKIHGYRLRVNDEGGPIITEEDRRLLRLHGFIVGAILTFRGQLYEIDATKMRDNELRLQLCPTSWRRPEYARLGLRQPMEGA